MIISAGSGHIKCICKACCVFLLLALRMRFVVLLRCSLKAKCCHWLQWRVGGKNNAWLFIQFYFPLGVTSWFVSVV
jgi:hypothetical protein